jgi:hypothetical protein
MTNTTNKIATQRMSPSWRKHVRRLKQEARKTGIAYKTSRPVVSIPQAPDHHRVSPWRARPPPHAE